MTILLYIFIVLLTLWFIAGISTFIVFLFSEYNHDGAWKSVLLGILILPWFIFDGFRNGRHKKEYWDSIKGENDD